MVHHEIFKQFQLWRGKVSAGYVTDFVGAMLRSDFVEETVSRDEECFLSSQYPAFDEEYFEWIDCLESVVAAQDRFVMIELGAGYGRWLVRAASALRRIKEVPFYLIGVEGEPTHFEWMKLHFRNNHLDPHDHHLIHAAVSETEGVTWFYTGDPAEWYGQAIAYPSFPPEDKLIARQDVNTQEIRTITLDSILDPLESVDLIDFDIQGAEGIVLAGARQLDAKVKKVHIGTHGEAIEASLRQTFFKLGWRNVHDYACGCEDETPYGKIHFHDGVQTWINPALT